jgi:hypothetical protein
LGADGGLDHLDRHLVVQLRRNAHTSVIPAGFGIGKVWTIDRFTLNPFAEPQYLVIRSGIGVPKWQIFAGFNVQMALRPQ